MFLLKKLVNILTRLEHCWAHNKFLMYTLSCPQSRQRDRI